MIKMAEKEIEDYIKTQKSLGVRNDDIHRSLVNAGYSEEEFRHLLERHSSSRKSFWSKEFSPTTRHLMRLNIAVIIIFGILFAYITYDYNAKFQDLSSQRGTALIMTILIYVLLSIFDRTVEVLAGRVIVANPSG